MSNKNFDITASLKYLVVLAWIGVGVFLYSPKIDFDTAVFAEKLDVKASNSVGLVLEEMKPVSQRAGASSVITYPSAASSASSISGYYLKGSYTTQDLRAIAMENFLTDKGSPMAPYANLIITTSDQNNIDHKIFVAISGVESGFGSAGRAATTGHNPIGWRGGPGGTFNIFVSYSESIPHLIGGLSRGYGSNPNPYLIQGVYCPPCEAAGTNEWANGVSKYISQIEEYENAL